MVEKIYLKNSYSENVFGELFRGGMFDQNIVVIVQNSNKKIEEQFYEELVSNLKHNNIPYFRLYDFDSQDNLDKGVDNVNSSIAHLNLIGYSGFIGFGKNLGGVYCMYSAVDNDQMGSLILINPGDEKTDFDKLIKRFTLYKGDVCIIQSGGVDSNWTNNVEKLAQSIENVDFEIIDQADNNYSFVRDYRRMYRSVIEFIIENK